MRKIIERKQGRTKLRITKETYLILKDLVKEQKYQTETKADI